MRRLCLAAVLCSAGCLGNVVGPFEQRTPMRVDDPRLSIQEQERRGRDRLALLGESSDIAPRTCADLYGVHGR